MFLFDHIVPLGAQSMGIKSGDDYEVATRVGFGVKMRNAAVRNSTWIVDGRELGLRDPAALDRGRSA